MSTHPPPAPPEGCHDADELVPCPTCGRATDSVKHYYFPAGTFLLIAFSIGRRLVGGCPGCVRSQLLVLAARQVITLNVVWPVVVLPTLLLWLVSSCQRGHVPPESAAASGWLSLAAILTGGSAVLFGIAAVFSPTPWVIIVLVVLLLIYAL